MRRALGIKTNKPITSISAFRLRHISTRHLSPPNPCLVAQATTSRTNNTQWRIYPANPTPSSSDRSPPDNKSPSPSVVFENTQQPAHRLAALFATVLLKQQPLLIIFEHLTSLCFSFLNYTHVNSLLFLSYQFRYSLVVPFFEIGEELLEFGDDSRMKVVCGSARIKRAGDFPWSLDLACSLSRAQNSCTC